jgi:hypothetical protein
MREDGSRCSGSISSRRSSQSRVFEEVIQCWVQKKAAGTATQKGGTVVYEYSLRRDIKLKEQDNVTLRIKKLSK